jgi:hypothetical protein
MRQHALLKARWFKEKDMREQIGHRYTKTGNGQRRVPQKGGSYYPQMPANPHHAGHSAGIHPEDQPFISDDLEEGDEYYNTRLPTSSRRYDVLADGQVIRAGNKRIIVHYGEPPIVQQRKSLGVRDEKPRLRYHPLVYIGLFLIILISGFLGLNAFSAWWQTKQDDWTYGQSPRTYQVEANVGHGTQANPMSHFMALNLSGSIQVIEEPGDDAGKARSYQITVIPDNQGNPPVKVVFQDLNRDGKLDMLVEIGDPGSYITVMLFNNGTQFVSKL